MRTFAIGTIAIALLAASCTSPTSVDVESDQDASSPVTTSPVTTSPVAVAPAKTSPVEASDVAPVDEPIAPSDDQDDESELAEQESVVTTQPPKETSETPPPTNAIEPPPSGLAAVAIADLAARLGVDESAVRVVSIQEVTWSDGSFGCPQPGMSYTQAIVSGSLIVLEVNGASYEYHSGASGDPFYCANPAPPISAGYVDR